MEVVASLSQGRTAAVQCGLFTHKSVLVIFEPPCIYINIYINSYIYINIYINSTNIPPIMIINMIYETQNLLSL